MMLKGANANVVTKELEARVEKVQKMLPEGVSVEPYLNRSELVNRNISTVVRNLIEGALIVFLVLIVFLGNVRAGLIVASVIPLAMLFGFILMRVFGVSANLMSLGAIDFGIVTARLLSLKGYWRISIRNGLPGGRSRRLNWTGKWKPGRAAWCAVRPLPS